MSELVKLAEDKAFGQKMAGAFFDELTKIAWEGEPGPVEHALGEQQKLERFAEEHRMVGNPKSDRLNRTLARQQGTAGDQDTVVRNVVMAMGKTAAISRKPRYNKYFRHKMIERGITSPTQLTEEQKKQFFNRVDTGWHSKSEEIRKVVA